MEDRTAKQDWELPADALLSSALWVSASLPVLALALWMFSWTTRSGGEGFIAITAIVGCLLFVGGGMNSRTRVLPGRRLLALDRMWLVVPISSKRLAWDDCVELNLREYRTNHGMRAALEVHTKDGGVKQLASAWSLGPLEPFFFRLSRDMGIERRVAGGLPQEPPSPETEGIALPRTEAPMPTPEPTPTGQHAPVSLELPAPGWRQHFILSPTIGLACVAGFGSLLFHHGSMLSGTAVAPLQAVYFAFFVAGLVLAGWNIHQRRIDALGTTRLEVAGGRLETWVELPSGEKTRQRTVQLDAIVNVDVQPPRDMLRNRTRVRTLVLQTADARHEVGTGAPPPLLKEAVALVASRLRSSTG